MWWLSLFNAKTVGFDNVTIVSVTENDYRIHFLYMNKDEAIIILKNSDLCKKSRSLWKGCRGWIIKTLIIKKLKKNCWKK